MSNRRRSATARSVPAQTPEQLLELTQEHIRPLIAMIDRLNEAGAEHELRVHNLRDNPLIEGCHLCFYSSAHSFLVRKHITDSHFPPPPL